MKPSIAYVVPAYNATATLAQTLRCLLAQTLPHWEAVVIDDGSDDDPGAVVQAIADPRIRLVRQPNAGLAGARNTGWLNTSAPAVCFLDADDLIAPAHAQRLLNRLGDRDAAACASRMAGPDGEDLEWILTPGSHDLTPDRLLEANPVCVGAVVLAREALPRLGIGAPPFNATMRVAEDWDLWLRLTLAGARWAAVEPEPLFTYRLRPGSLYANIREMWQAGVTLIRRAAGDTRAALDAARGWTLRCLARAVVRQDEAMIAEMLFGLGRLRETDIGVLVGALRWGFCREHCIPPARVGERANAWRNQARLLLRDQPLAHAIIDRLDWGTDRWQRAAVAASSLLAAGQTLVVYGLGHNGRGLLAALQQERVPVAFIDDHPEARAACPKLQLADLTSRHTVVVTPDERAGIMAKLRTARVRNVLLPEDLLKADYTLAAS